MKLADRIQACQKCTELASKRKNVVIGEGAVPAPCIFLGEGPGEKEDEKGLPFVGRAGAVLRTAMGRVGFKPGEYHILNCLKCRPPDNRNPTPEELKNCRPFLVKQIEAVRPKIIVALGRFAQAFILNESPDGLPVLANSGKIVTYKEGVNAMLTMHPSFVSRHLSDDVYIAFVRHLSRSRRLALGGK